MNSVVPDSIMDGVRVLVTDLDETLFPPEKQVLPDEFETAMRSWRGEGRTWVIATGRSRDQLHLFYDEWNIHPDYYISRARFIYVWGHSEDDEKFQDWNERMRTLTEHQQNYTKEWMELVEDWSSKRNVSVRMDEAFAVFNSASEAKKAAQFLQEHIRDEFNILRHRWFLIVIPEGVGKGKALDHLVRDRGWEPEQILCVGDGMNDLDMFNTKYGYGAAAVSNAETPVKEFVREISGYELPWPGGVAVPRLLEKSIN